MCSLTYVWGLCLSSKYYKISIPFSRKNMRDMLISFYGVLLILLFSNIPHISNYPINCYPHATVNTVLDFLHTFHYQNKQCHCLQV